MNNLVIITGSTGGLGKSYVTQCATRGYDIVLSATKQNRLDELKQNLQQIYPNLKFYAKACDLSNDQSREEFWQFIKDNNLKPNMLINNAGYILEGSFCGCSNQEIVNATKVNTVGTLDFCHKFLAQIDKSVRNYILIVSSLASFYPMPQMSVYGGTKAMLTSFSVALRQELKAQKVNVSVCCPGSMATNDDMKASIKSQGIGGKLSLQDTDKIAKISINKLLKNKAKYIPGAFNKTMFFLSKLVPQTWIASGLYKRWVSCEKKRNSYR